MQVHCCGNSCRPSVSMDCRTNVIAAPMTSALCGGYNYDAPTAQPAMTAVTAAPDDSFVRPLFVKQSAFTLTRSSADAEKPARRDPEGGKVSAGRAVVNTVLPLLSVIRPKIF